MATMASKHLLNTAASAIALLAGAALTALATAPAAAEVFDEVVVTAQKREQNVQDVGVSITAFSGDQVRELGFTNTVDIVNFTPGLNYTSPNAEGSQVNFFLRGVGLNDFTDGNENPVAVYFDDVYRGAIGGLALQLFDMERVEVLRGPQGTLYGRNTTGGLVHFISKKPTSELDAYAQFSAGSFGEIKSEAAIGGPLSDTLSARVSFASNNNNGYTKNRYPGIDDYNETDAIAGRLQILWAPRDNVEVLLKGHGARNHAQVGAWQHEVVVATEAGDNRRVVGPTEDLYGAGAGNDAFGYRDTDGDPWAGEYDRDGKVEVEATGGSAHVNIGLGDGVTLTNIAAYDHTDRLQEEDTDAGPAPLIMPTFAAKTRQITEELRLQGDYDSSNWVLGFYYFNQKVDGAYDLDLTNLGFVYFDADYTQKSKSWSFFGQYEREFAPGWSFVAGLRYAKDTKSLDYQNLETTGLYEAATLGFIPPADLGLSVSPPLTNYRPNPGDAFIFNESTVGDLANVSDSNLTGKFEIDYRPNDDLLLYASYSRGAKTAGFNTGFLDGTFIFASNTEATIPFGSEKINAYETGFKARLFDGAARLNGAAFYYDYNDFQTFRFELLNSIIFNTDARVYGGELEFQASPAQGLDVAFGLSLLDATARNIPAIGTGTLHDRKMVSAPDVSFNGLIRYEHPFANGMLAALVKTRYQGETYYDIQNFDTSRADSYWVSDARLQWTTPNDHIQLAVFVNNFANKEYRTYTFDFSSFGFNQVAYGAPRWFGGSISYNY